MIIEEQDEFTHEAGEELRKLLLGHSWEITAYPGNYHVIATRSIPEGTDVELYVYCPKRIGNLGSVNIDRDFASERMSDIRVFVLAVPMISTELQEQCRALGWNWFDLEGNCRICVPGVLDIQTTSHPER